MMMQTESRAGSGMGSTVRFSPLSVRDSLEMSGEGLLSLNDRSTKFEDAFVFSDFMSRKIKGSIKKFEDASSKVEDMNKILMLSNKIIGKMPENIKMTLRNIMFVVENIIFSCASVKDKHENIIFMCSSFEKKFMSSNFISSSLKFVRIPCFESEKSTPEARNHRSFYAAVRI